MLNTLSPLKMIKRPLLT